MLMKYRDFDLSGNNLTLYEGAQLMPDQVVLLAHGTLDECLAKEEPSILILFLQSPVQRMYGLGFLKPDEVYKQGSTVRLDCIDSIAGYGTLRPWGDFIRFVKLEALVRQTKANESKIIVP